MSAGKGAVAQGIVWHPRLVAALPGLVLIVIGVLGFLVVYDSVRERDDLWFTDDAVLAWMVAHRTAVATSVLTVVTNLFGPVVLPILVGVGCLWWGSRPGAGGNRGCWSGP
ncbi:hypothetical protein NKG05_02190 [Oerskovia sp. M15]